MNQIFKRYKYVSKTFSRFSLEKNNPLESNIDEKATAWINDELALCGPNAAIVSVNTEYIPPERDIQRYTSLVLISVCIGINEKV